MLQLARPPLQLWSGPMHRRPLLLHAALGAGVQAPLGRGKGEGGRRKKRGERRREGGAGGEAPCCRNVILHQPGRFWANLRPNRAGIDALDSPEGVEHGKPKTKFSWAVFGPPQSSPTHPSPPVGLPRWGGPCWHAGTATTTVPPTVQAASRLEGATDMGGTCIG